MRPGPLPGIWLDDVSGTVHILVREMLESRGLAPVPAEVDAVARAVAAALVLLPPAKVNA